MLAFENKNIMVRFTYEKVEHLLKIVGIKENFIFILSKLVVNNITPKFQTQHDNLSSELSTTMK